MVDLSRCLVCGTPLTDGYYLWHQACSKCLYECSSLSPSINAIDPSIPYINEEERQKSLYTVREHNFKRIVKKLSYYKPDGGNLLEIGCGHGWFLEIAGKSFHTQGVEPDTNVYNIAKAKGLPIRNGFFPEILEEHERFDIIIFNDVFEHISDLHEMLAVCNTHLNKDGLLVVNLPSSSGIIYRTSKLLLKFGVPSFFKRMWQYKTPSPHLHYFNPNNLSKMLSKRFYVEEAKNLKSITASGLWERLFITSEPNKFIGVLSYLCMLVCMPIMPFLPKDTFFIIAKKKD